MIEASPWLLYWRGVCLLHRDLRESRKDFEMAFHVFDESRDHSGAIYSWAGAVEAISLLNDQYADLDPWIEWLDKKMGNVIHFTSPKIEAQVVPQMLIALAVRQPDHPRMPLWEGKIESLMRNREFDASHRVVFATYLMGGCFIPGYYHRAASVLNEMRPLVNQKRISPFVFIKWLFADASYAAYTGSVEECFNHLERAFQVAEETGINVLNGLLLYIGAQGSILLRQSDAVGAYLNKLESLPYLPANIQAEYHMAAAGRSLLERDDREAAGHYSIAAGIYDRTGNRVYAAVGYAYASMVWSDAGENQKAEEAILEAQRQDVTRLPASGLALLMAEAYLEFAYGREAEGHKKIALFLSLGREHGTIPFPYCPQRPLAFLCANALETGQGTEYVKGIIRTHRLQPDHSHKDTEHWPWPLRIYTLGGFRIFRDDTLLEFTGKTPQKPLELLKALIAFGGSNVAVEKITEALWPDAEGDLAHQSFESALSRLRKLIGEDCIKLSVRQLSLNLQHCWVDSIALNNILNRFKGSGEDRYLGIYSEAILLYKGQFLPSDSGCEWAAARSETLKNSLLRLIGEAGRLYERDSRWEEAADCCQKGLDTDPLAEEFYRRLMICYQRLGRRAEAVQLYNRCRSLLYTQLGIKPSSETEAVYSSIIQQQ